MSSKFATINVNKARALLQVRDGADVWALNIAKLLREVHREHPSLVSIGPAHNPPDGGHLTQPYFGAQATELGVRVAEERLTDLVGSSDGFTYLENQLLDLIEDFDEIMDTAIISPGHHDLAKRARDFCIEYRPQISLKEKK